MEVSDYVVKRGPYADDPRWEADARAMFMAEFDGPADEAERIFALWLAEGRVAPGGPLMLAEGYGDRIVKRADP